MVSWSRWTSVAAPTSPGCSSACTSPHPRRPCWRRCRCTTWCSTCSATTERRCWSCRTSSAAPGCWSWSCTGPGWWCRRTSPTPPGALVLQAAAGARPGGCGREAADLDVPAGSTVPVVDQDPDPAHHRGDHRGLVPGHRQPECAGVAAVGRPQRRRRAGLRR